MINPNLTEYSQEKFLLLAGQLKTQRQELTQIFIWVLRNNIFINHIQLRPREIDVIAVREVDALITDFQTLFATVFGHGESLCNSGLSTRTVFELLRAQWKFFTTILEPEFRNQDLASIHQSYILEGYLQSREKMIIREQENIRRAFEIAIAHSNDRTKEAQEQVQKATETSHRQTIIAQEDERRRISRELHDDAGQTMVGLRMSLENLKALHAEGADLTGEINQSISLTNKALEKIRTASYSLRPPMLDMLGLNLAVKQLCVDFSEQTRLIIDYQGRDTPTLNDELAISIYRIVQESLTNIIKHAHAKRAWIKLKPMKNKLSLSIIDDGKGFDPETIKAGIGLESMQERCRLVNGQMLIESKPGRSTMLVFSFPIKK